MSQSFMGMWEHCYKGSCPELLARTLSGPNMEKFNVNTLALSQQNFWKKVLPTVNMEHLRRTAVDTASNEGLIWLLGECYHTSDEITILVNAPICDQTIFPFLINKVQ